MREEVSYVGGVLGTVKSLKEKFSLMSDYRGECCKRKMWYFSGLVICNDI